jgi:uncharacterized protein (DUF1501 family)
MRGLNRREVLKALSALGLSAAAMPFGMRNLVFAADASTPILIVMHLRGGCDGLNLISPASDNDFIAARASDLRVLAEGKDAGYQLANGPNIANGPAIDFRLHNAAGGLAELYKSGNLAFVHACGLTDATRSHFVATDMIEAGVASQTDLSRSENGWLTRSIDAHGKNARGLEAVAVSGSLAGDLRGLDQALAAPDINNGLPIVGGPPVASVLWQMYGGRTDALGESGQLALQLPLVIDQHVARDASGKILPYAPENGVTYDSAGGFANTMKSVARLIKMDIGLQSITLDYGNWDTHEYQAGRFKGQLEPMSNGLAAFWNDISAYHDRVALVTVTEFGRRLRSNKSGGTDHGRAGVMTVLGGKVRGGKIYGPWPGLNSTQLDEGVDLAVTTDYRQVLTEALDHTMGRKGSEVFPSFKPGTPLGLFAS